MKGYIVDIKEENVDLGFNVKFERRYAAIVLKNK